MKSVMSFSKNSKLLEELRREKEEDSAIKVHLFRCLLNTLRAEPMPMVRVFWRGEE